MDHHGEECIDVKTAKVGDKIYCEKRKKEGVIIRKNALGCVKTDAIGVMWLPEGKRDTIIGKECCEFKCCKM